MCKWNAFAIDSPKVLCEHEYSARENIFLLRWRESNPPMPGIIATPAVADQRKVLDLPFGFVKALLEAAKTPVWVAEKSGRVLLSNEHARRYVGPESGSD